MRRTLLLVFLIATLPLFGLTPQLVEVRPGSIPTGSQERYMSVGGSKITVKTLFRITGNARVFELNPLTVTTNYSYTTGTLQEFAQLWIPIEVSSNIGVYKIVASNDEGVWSNALDFEVTGPRAPELYVPPSGVTAEATGPEGAIVTYAYQSNVADVDCDIWTGSLFPLGNTTVTCTAHDWSTNQHVSRSFTVAVVDRTPPEMTIPHEILAPATTSEGATVTWETHATDIVDGEVGVQCSPASGSFFKINTATQVNCSAVDAHHNATTRSFNVTVVDNVTPVLTIPSDITAPATSEHGTNVWFEATAKDYAGRSIPVNCEPVSGSVFPIGTTTVQCTATDDRERISVGTFKVTVTANPPALTLPADITTVATSNAGAVVEYTATAKDDLDGDLPVTCTHPSGSTFPIGTTTVHCMATSSKNQSSFGKFDVTVTDDRVPTLTLPDDIIAPATSPDGAVVEYAATAHDAFDGDLKPDCAPPPGSTFAIGTTTVTCTATNSRGKSASGTFDVTVTEEDKGEAPVLTLPADITAEATSPNGADVTYSATANDEEDGAIAAACAPASGSSFPIGTTTVTCTATDSDGQTASGTFNVTVEDSMPPAILAITANPNRLWPVNRKLVSVTVDVAFSDDGDGAPVWKIVDVQYNEPVTPDDVVITGDHTVDLRAERNGDEIDRIYTIVVEITDASGNRSRGSVNVVVPHDNSAGNGATTPAPAKKRPARRG